MARAKNLHDLIFTSSSTREYFLSLPVELQMKLHDRNDYIRSAFELRRHADFLRSIRHLGE